MDWQDLVVRVQDSAWLADLVERLDALESRQSVWAPPALPAPLAVLLPAAAGVLLVGHDGLAALPYPRLVRAAYRILTTPFRNFLTLEDLEEPADEPVPEPLWKYRVLAAGAILEAAVYGACLAYGASVGDRAGVVSAGVGVAAWIYAALRVALKPPQTPPYLLILFYLVYASISGVAVSFAFVDGPLRAGPVFLDLLHISVTLLLAWTAGTFPLYAIPPSRNVAKRTDVPSSALSMPEDGVNFWTWSTFSFVDPLFDVANRHTLDDTDCWALSPFFTHKNLFRKYLKYRERYPKHSTLRFLLVTNSLDLILDVALDMYGAVSGFVPPFALQQILASLADPSPGARRTAYFYALVTFLVHLSFAQVDLYKLWHSRRSYERSRGQLFCALHYKALTRRDAGNTAAADADEENKGAADLGQIVNLMQGDAYAVAQRFWSFSGVFSAPVRLTIAMVYLYTILGWSSLAAVFIVVLAYVVNYPLATYSVYVTRQSWKARDKRMNMVNELFQNVRFLKFYGWESRWAARVKDSRESELRWRVKESIVSTAIAFIWTWMPSATALISFLCYTLLARERLTVSTAFTAIALFSQLQGPMMELPGHIFAWLHAYVSMQRIEAFLAEDEVEPWASTLKMPAEMRARVGARDEVGFDGASFEWGPVREGEQARFRLGPLNVTFPEGKLSLISGPTGSGKSAMLGALLGEMHCVEGNVILNKAGHQVAYCAQNPWLEHATIRDNIVFASPAGFDQARYDAVIDACALSRDLAIFDAGDMTEIGEKGITLSGGQRARIALARALYSQASCILLDDPLAAVDMHTAQHLARNALFGPLVKDRTVILVTHHISLCLPIASYLIELSAGSVQHQGSIQELLDEGVLRKVVEAEDVHEEDVPESTTPPAVENEADKLQEPGDTETEPKKRVKTGGKLVEAEARAEGRVSLHTYLTYIRAAGVISWCLTIFLMFFIRLITIGNQFFIAKWGEAYETSEPSVLQAFVNRLDIWEGLPPPDLNVIPWLTIFCFISLAGALSVLLYIAIGYYASLQASRKLFIAMLERLSRAPSRFFDITPVGRILNRFTADINTVDNALQNSGRAALSGLLNFVASFVVIVCVVPIFAPFAAFIAWLYIRLAPAYVKASRDLRRLESVSLSPAFAGFDELLRGLAHVRAFGMEERYQDRFYQRVDKFQSFDHVYWLVTGWLSWRYDCLGSVVVFLTTLFALWTSVSDGFAAVVIVQAGIFADASRQLVRVLAQLELDFNSVERIVEYLGVPQEAPAVLPENRPAAYWPSSGGELVVEDLVVKYAPELPPVLHRLSFVVKPSEKIGVVGRTGSGKSTLALSLLRIVEPNEGRIIIDNVDITKIGLDDLRARITIVSQDVSLFSGSIRSNLDPFDEHTDRECWDVLERCHLSAVLNQSAAKAGRAAITLDTPIAQTGSLSAGERQLVALARAVLRRSNVVIMDEATSQIDAKLDDQIQRTIREEFAGAVVITIAHRLKTVLDYDRILVLGAGEILEFDTPKALISKPGGVFRDMCRASADWHDLLAMVDGQR